jgi:transcriptional regulator with XRE-family HTH domain
MPDMPTGALVRLYRIQRRMSTVSLATHAGITVRYLEMIEAASKTPSLPVLRKLAKVLGLRTSALARSLVNTLVKRAKPSYAAEVREFAGRIGLLN